MIINKSLYSANVLIETYNGYSSTRKFNCHDYAWHRVENNKDRWIGNYLLDNDPEYTHWEDGSYIVLLSISM